MSDKKYWQSFSDRNQSEAFLQSSQNPCQWSRKSLFYWVLLFVCSLIKIAISSGIIMPLQMLISSLVCMFFDKDYYIQWYYYAFANAYHIHPFVCLGTQSSGNREVVKWSFPRSNHNKHHPSVRAELFSSVDSPLRGKPSRRDHMACSWWLLCK